MPRFVQPDDGCGFADSVGPAGVPTRHLTDLANHHGSDKGTEGPSPDWAPHKYTDVYEAYLGHLRQMPLNVLEVRRVCCTIG